MDLSRKKTVPQETVNRLLADFHRFCEANGIEIKPARAARIVRKFVHRHEGDLDRPDRQSYWNPTDLDVTYPIKDSGGRLAYRISKMKPPSKEQMMSTTTESVEASPIFTAPFGIYDVAAALACHPVTVRKIIKSGQLTAFRVGPHFKVMPADLQDYIRRSAANVITAGDA